MSEIIPCYTGKLEESEKIEQVSESSNTPLRIDFHKPKRNHKECQDQTKPVEIVIWILKIRMPLPKEKTTLKQPFL